MAIQMSEGFSLLSNMPLDGRITFPSINAMKNTPDYQLYDGILSCIKGDVDKKTYQWWAINSVDDKLGKWREFKSDAAPDIEEHNTDTNSHADIRQAVVDAIADAKQYTNTVVGGVQAFGIKIVNELPTSDIQERTIYFVSKTDPEQGDIYLEYMYIENAWELIGSTSINMSNFYTKEDVDNLLINKVDAYPNKGLSSNDFTNTDKQHLDDAHANMHSHSNRNVIDYLGEKDGNLTFHGNLILAGAEEEITDAEIEQAIQEDKLVGGYASIVSNMSDYTPEEIDALVAETVTTNEEVE